MRNLAHRINRLEKTLDQRPCPACSDARTIFLIRNQADQEELDRRMKFHAEHCTCGRPFHVKRIILMEE